MGEGAEEEIVERKVCGRGYSRAGGGRGERGELTGRKAIAKKLCRGYVDVILSVCVCMYVCVCLSVCLSVCVCVCACV